MSRFSSTFETNFSFSLSMLVFRVRTRGVWAGVVTYIFFLHYSLLFFFCLFLLPCFYLCLVSWYIAWRINCVCSATVATLWYYMNTNFLLSLFTSCYSTLMLLNPNGTCTSNTFLWAISTTSHLLVSYATACHAYWTWSGLQVPFNYFNNSPEPKSRCTELSCFDFSLYYNHYSQTTFIAHFLLFSKTIFVDKPMGKVFLLNTCWRFSLVFEQIHTSFT